MWSLQLRMWLLVTLLFGIIYALIVIIGSSFLHVGGFSFYLIISLLWPRQIPPFRTRATPILSAARERRSAPKSSSILAFTHPPSERQRTSEKSTIIECDKGQYVIFLFLPGFV